MWRHRVLLLAWAVTIVCFVSGFLVNAAFAVLAQFAAVALACVTVARIDRLGVLRYTLAYRGALGLLLLATGTTLVTAGSTVALGGERGITPGFITLACTNLVAVILTWRALTNPAPRRAAVVGLVAVVAELVALVVDAAISINLDYQPGSLGGVALVGSFVSMWVGALVCVAALVSFEPAPMYIVPSARVVDDDVNGDGR